VPAVVFALAFGVYAWTAAPGLGWLDSAELTAAAATLGIAHPPGHPIPLLLGKLIALLPLGDVAHRVNLASALAGAGAAAAVGWAAARVAARVARAPAAAIGAATGLAFAFGAAAWDQAVRAEVYAAEAALVCVALAALLDGRVRVAAFATGLALANHHFVTLLFALPAALHVLAPRPPPAAVGRAAALGALGLAAYLYLPLRAARDIIGWGDPDRLDAFLWVVSARAFQKSLAGPQEALATRAGDLATALVGDAGIIGALLAAVGLYALLRARATWRDAGLLAGVLGLGVAGRALLGFDPDNPDAHGYLLPAIAALCVLAAAGAAVIVRAVPRARALVAAAVFAWPAGLLWGAAGDVSRRGADAAEAHAHLLLAPLPPRSLAITSYFETSFLLGAAQAVLGERPDVTVVDRNLLSHPHAVAAARRRHPDLAWILGDRLARGKLPARSDRPIAVELAPNLPFDPRLVPLGGLARLAPAPLSPAQRALAEREHAARAALEDAAAARTAAPRDRHGARRVLAWSSYNTARHDCALGRRDAARAELARARSHAGGRDETIEELAAACAGR
jgi:hypothetical protein